MNRNDGSRYVIALYVRLSMEDCRTGSMSIENQKLALHHFVDSMEDVRNIEVLEYVDNGYSGTNFERPAVQAMLNDVQARKINCIVVKDFSRFARSGIEAGYFMEMVFPLYDVRFISINDAFDSNALHGDTGGVSSAFKYLAAEFYSRDISAKTKSAKYAKFRRGEYQSKVCPYGYRKGPGGRLEPDEETAPVVRLIFEMTRNGRKTSEIIEELFRREIPTPGEYKNTKGGPYYDVSRNRGLWNSSSLRNILDDERYIGTYIMGRREVTRIGGRQQRVKDESEWFKVPDHHPAIVSKEVYAQAQAQRRRNTAKRVEKAVPQYLLRGKVFCGYCGHALTRVAAKHPSFQCRYIRLDKTAACHGLRITEKELEKRVYDAIVKRARVILEQDARPGKERLNIQLAEQSECERRIEICMEQKHALYEKLVSREIDLNIYRTLKAGIDIDLNRWKERHAALAARTSQMRMDDIVRSGWVDAAREAADADGLTAELVKKLIARVDVHPNLEIEVSWEMDEFPLE